VNTVLNNQRMLLLRELRNLATLRRDHADDLVVSLLLSAAERQITADMSFLDDAEETLAAQTSWRAATPTRPPSRRRQDKTSEPPSPPMMVDRARGGGTAHRPAGGRR
jgi:hypothetical protein